MQIHVVSKDDTLSQIANTYNTTVAAIKEANDIPKDLDIVIGEALVIPIVGQYYFVESGDSLYRIGQVFGFTAEELAKVNRISLETPLQIGQKLYIPPVKKTVIESNAYIEPLKEVTQNQKKQAREATPLLTYLAPFSFRATPSGELIEPPLTDLNEIAQENQATIMMVITNLESGAFSQSLARAILSNEAIQDILIHNIIKKAKQLQVKDIHFDFEFIPPDLKNNYISFLTKAKAELKKEGLLLSVALAPKTSSDQKGEWYEAHDYGAIGKIADFVVLMTYEWGYIAGPPMPISPLPEVTKVVKYALTEMPASKIMLGQNLYGYDWTLPFQEGDRATTVSPNRAVDIAREHNTIIQYEYTVQAPFVEYLDQNGKDHIVWFEDARSIQMKYELIKEYQLRGISFWKLGFAFPQAFELLGENFLIKKY